MKNYAALWTSLMAADAALATKMVLEPVFDDKITSPTTTEKKAFWLGAAESAIELAVGGAAGVAYWMYSQRKKK